MNPIRAWSRFWFAPVSAAPLGAFRILFGLICLIHVACLAWEPAPWLSDAGYLRGSEARELAGWLRPSPLQWYQDPTTVNAVLAATALCAALVTAGRYTRIASVLLYLGLLSLHHRMLLTVSGADTLLLCTAFALMFTPSGAAYALDARRTRLRRGDGPADPIVAPWGFRLIQIQLTILYFMTGLLKARGTTWADGSALYYVLSDPEFRRASFGLTAYPALMNALTFGALLLELALPFLLWVRAARPFVIPAGVMLHAGIIATVNIPVFSELCVATYLLFLTGGEWAAIARVFARSGRRRRVTRVDTPSATYRGPHALRRAKREATSSIPAPHIMSDAAVYVGNDVGS